MPLRLLTRRAKQVGAALLVLGLAGMTAWLFVISWQPSPRIYPFQGPDVSAAQGLIEWSVVRGGGASFGYVVATIGADGRDPMFETNWQDMYAAGIRRGAIHVYSLCRLAMDQANNFNTTVPASDDALPAAVLIDFQPDCATRPDRAVVIIELRRLLTTVEAHTGKPSLLKVSRRFDASYRVTAAIPRTVWSMQDFFPPDYAARPWKMWQANAMRRIDGAKTLVHWNVVAP